MRLSEITVEQLRADHEAFARKMAEVREQRELAGEPDHERPRYAEPQYHPRWREELLSHSPFDDAPEQGTQMNTTQQIEKLKTVLAESHPDVCEQLTDIQLQLKQQEALPKRVVGSRSTVIETRVVSMSMLYDDPTGSRSLDEVLAKRYSDLLKQQGDDGYKLAHRLPHPSPDQARFVFERASRNRESAFNLNELVAELRRICQEKTVLNCVGRAEPTDGWLQAGLVADVLDPRRSSLHTMSLGEVAAKMVAVWRAAYAYLPPEIEVGTDDDDA